MKQTFDLSRFIQYFKYRIISNIKSILLIFGGYGLGILILMLIILSNDKNWGTNDWAKTFIPIAGLSGLILFGTSFSFLRNKDQRIIALLVPASILEKYIFELSTRLAVIFLFIPILLKGASIVAIWAAYLVFPNSHYGQFDISSLFIFDDSKTVVSILLTYLFALAIIYAGSISTRKLSFVITIIFVSAIIWLVVAYFYFLLEVLQMDKYMANFLRIVLPRHTKEQSFYILLVVLGISTVVAYVYSYFKLKELEV